MTTNKELAQLVEKFKNGYYERPDRVKHPTVWARFQGKTPRKDGTYPMFRVQDVTDEYVEEIISCTPLFMRGVLGNEIMETKEVEILEEYTKLLWRAIMNDHVALMCITDDGGTQKLAGFQINEVSSKLRTPEDIKSYSNKFNSLISTSIHSFIQDRLNNNVFKKYNVPCYLDAFGLFVKQEFRCQGIALHLQKAKIPLCKALGIRVIANGFGSDIASSIALKVGFELLYKKSLAETFNVAAEQLPETCRTATFMGMIVE